MTLLTGGVAIDANVMTGCGDLSLLTEGVAIHANDRTGCGDLCHC